MVCSPLPRAWSFPAGTLFIVLTMFSSGKRGGGGALIQAMVGQYLQTGQQPSFLEAQYSLRAPQYLVHFMHK